MNKAREKQKNRRKNDAMIMMKLEEDEMKKKQDRDAKSVLIECTKEDEDFRPLDFQHDHLRIHIN